MISEQNEWLIWSVEKNSGHSGQSTETVVSLVSGKKKVDTMMTNSGMPQMLLARQVCVCETSAFV